MRMGCRQTKAVMRAIKVWQSGWCAQRVVQGWPTRGQHSHCPGTRDSWMTKASPETQVPPTEPEVASPCPDGGPCSQHRGRTGFLDTAPNPAGK